MVEALGGRGWDHAYDERDVGGLNARIVCEAVEAAFSR